MESVKVSGRIKGNAADFIQKLKGVYGEELISVILYGSASSGEFIERHSNLNLLVVLKDAGLGSLNKAPKTRGRFAGIAPLFLTEGYIRSSSDVFPVEFLDMKENYKVLYGKDVLKDVDIDTRNLRFQCEQELKAKLVNLKQLYLAMNRDRAALRNLLFKSFNSTLHILRNIIRLKGRQPPYLKQEIVRETARDFPINKDNWERILAAKNKELKAGGSEIRRLFLDFVGDLEAIADAVDKI